MAKVKVVLRGVGLIGSLVADKLRSRGDSVVIVSRQPGRFAPSQKVISRSDTEAQLEALSDCDAVINLEGANIARVWTKSYKEEIRQSRIESVTQLGALVREVQNPRLKILQASATGFYGDRGDTLLDEQSPPGGGFLAQVCVEWEKAASDHYPQGRFALFRIAPVLSRRGGIFPIWRNLFRRFLGGRLGSGRQFFSWIHEQDMAELLLFYLDHFAAGAINACAPQPITNREMTQILADTFGRPALIPVPSFVLSALPGGFGQEMLLSSVRTVPARALKDGFRFRFGDFAAAVADLA
ncbi:MAG: TIGR01777 family oxidoreductase [Turneriella sp.]|nr:TIGR01777 family oxidoreductase [Leptospiraceae bacterium]MCX7633419.1 TIGR01777 family oxidoreductase [Turneriella sp.]